MIMRNGIFIFTIFDFYRKLNLRKKHDNKSNNRRHDEKGRRHFRYLLTIVFPKQIYAVIRFQTQAKIQ